MGAICEERPIVVVGGRRRNAESCHVEFNPRQMLLILIFPPSAAFSSFLSLVPYRLWMSTIDNQRRFAVAEKTDSFDDFGLLII